jgi:hypothetical protein
VSRTRFGRALRPFARTLGAKKLRNVIEFITDPRDPLDSRIREVVAITRAASRALREISGAFSVIAMSRARFHRGAQMQRVCVRDRRATIPRVFEEFAARRKSRIEAEPKTVLPAHLFLTGSGCHRREPTVQPSETPRGRCFLSVPGSYRARAVRLFSSAGVSRSGEEVGPGTAVTANTRRI